MESEMIQKPGKRVRHFRVLYAGWLATLSLVGMLVITSCARSADVQSIEDSIREYLYGCQPTSGQEFVEWADVELAQYSPRQVLTALRNESEFQTGRGHPNFVGVLSFAAQAWAQKYDLPYDASEWIVMQQEAKNNMRGNPGELSLWPRK